MTELEQALCLASEPPSDLPTYQWIEQNVELTPIESDLPGKLSFEFFPASRFFLNRLDHPKLRKTTVMKCSQSGFTETASRYLIRRVKDSPVTTAWIGAVANKAQEDAKKRFWPAIRGCKAVQPLSPEETDKKRWTSRLIMFDTMNLMIRGSNAISGLRGDPVGLIICDERADWKKGRIHNARQRLTTKKRPIEISIGAAGDKDGELHTDWKEGSQTMIHFCCPHCQQSQPFRFGQEESVLYSMPRPRGGLVWEENEATKPEGIWNYEEVKKSTRFECEKCGHRFTNSEKKDLLASCHEIHRNPSALPENYSLQVPALLLIWDERSWGDIAVEFLKAVESMKFGDIETMRTFVTETLGEPWELRNRERAQSELTDRCGSYKLGQIWSRPEDLAVGHPKQVEQGTVLILTFDRQQFKIVYVVRQWRRNGQSRLVYCGEFPSYDELREFQLEHKIKDRCVWGDDGGKLASEFRQTCLRYGWQVLKGEDDEHFSFREEGEKSYKQGWRKTEFDPGIGQTSAGRYKMTAFLWSNPWFKDKLYNLFIPGKGPLWEIPADVPAEYLKQVTGNQWREKKRANGQIEGYWHESPPVDLADCELEQIVVADIGGLTRYLPSGPGGLPPK